MLTPGQYQFFAHDRIVWGQPMIQAVKAEIDRFDSERIFVVATRSLSRKTDVVTRLREAIGNRFVGLFDECEAHSPRPTVLAAGAAARAARPDLIITVGGGSAIDIGKMVIVCLAHEIEREEQFDALLVRVRPDGTPVVPKLNRSDCRQIVIPTTLSGAEFSHTAGMADHKRGVKDLFIGTDLAAPIIILDPATTVHTPEWLWLASGMRAVDHAVESICSARPHPFTDATCTAGLRMLQRSMRAARRNAGDLDARVQSQYAVWMCSTGMMRAQYGASHGISFHLSAIADVPHGHCSCVLLPAVMRFNKPVNAAQQSVVSEALDLPGRDAADAITALIDELGMPKRLRDVGIKREHFDQIARDGLGNMIVRTNPRPITRPEDILEILEMAW